MYESLKTNQTATNLGYVYCQELRKIMIALKIDLEPFQSTQVYKQFLPFQTLNFQKSEGIDSNYLRMPTKDSSGLQREYVMLFDCQRSLNKPQLEATNRAYFMQEVNHLFHKLIKQDDRISIIKFNSSEGVKIECSLIFKQLHEELLNKELETTIYQTNQDRHIRNDMSEAFQRAVCRIKHLSRQKIILLFLRSIAHHKKQIHKLNKNNHKDQTQSSLRQVRLSKQSQSCPDCETSAFHLTEFGSLVVSLLSVQKLRNLKVIVYCSKQDSIQQCATFFGLKDVNARIWRNSGGLNVHNNVMYMIEQKHKSDIDRVLMGKVVDTPDNHIFVL